LRTKKGEFYSGNLVQRQSELLRLLGGCWRNPDINRDPIPEHCGSRGQFESMKFAPHL